MTEQTVVPVRVQNVMDMEILRMNVWSVKFNSSSVMVVGFVRTPDGNSMNLVTSEAICKRMNQTLLFDVSGRFYELLGQIDKDTQLKQGMTSRVMEEFINGFPENWVFLVGQCLTTEQRSAIRPIQAAPRQPIRPKSPIVTLADETEVAAQAQAQREQKEQKENEQRRRREDKEKEDADATFRAPASFANGAITPIRFTRGASVASRNQRVFDATPTRQAPLASSTPQQKVQKVPTIAADEDLFAVPKLPVKKGVAPASDLDFLDDMDALFTGARINRTPSHRVPPKPQQRRRSRTRSRSPSIDRSRSRRYEEEFDSRMSRKRGYDRSPDYDDYRREESRRRFKESKRSRPRETSSSSGRSVRFESDYHRQRHDDRRRHEDREELERQERRRLKEIERREREVEERLKRSRRKNYSSSSSSDEDQDGSFNEWDAENREILDQSLLASTGGSSRSASGGNSRGRLPKREPSLKKAKPAAAAPKPKPRKKKEVVDLNDSIASNRPRRACATPATPAVKKITWPRRDLDKLKRVIELKKPSASEEHWTEVTRLLAKEGVAWTDVKSIAETKLKWKEPRQEMVEVEEEEEEERERKRRRGIAAMVKESVKMCEEIQTRNVQEDEMEGRVEEVEEYQPADVSADESLLAMSTPQITKKRGGTRKSTLPEPIEDSPMAKGTNSSWNSPRLNATKAKEQETTLRYVQHLTTMQTRPGSSMNKSYMNKSTASTRGKNTSLSVEEGTRKVQKMMKKAMAIEEEDEEEEDSDDEGETSLY